MTDHAEQPAELADLQGAWRRDGRSLSGGKWAEVSDVLWVQVGRHFCDLRTPMPRTEPREMLDLAQAFSGTVALSRGAISFHHDLDSLPRDPAHPDQGTVHRIGDVMMERGPGFEERWILASVPGEEEGVAERRAGSADGPLLARLVRVGSVALAVWGGPAPGGAQYSARHNWERERPLGLPDDGMEVDAAAMALGEAGPLPAGWYRVNPEEVCP